MDPVVFGDIVVIGGVGVVAINFFAYIFGRFQFYFRSSHHSSNVSPESFIYHVHFDSERATNFFTYLLRRTLSRYTHTMVYPAIHFEFRYFRFIFSKPSSRLFLDWAISTSRSNTHSHRSDKLNRRKNFDIFQWTPSRSSMQMQTECESHRRSRVPPIRQHYECFTRRKKLCRCLSLTRHILFVVSNGTFQLIDKFHWINKYFVWWVWCVRLIWLRYGHKHRTRIPCRARPQNTVHIIKSIYVLNASCAQTCQALNYWAVTL